MILEMILQEARDIIRIKPFKNSRYLKKCELELDPTINQWDKDLSNDKNFITVIDQIYNTKVHKLMMDYIKLSYNEWYGKNNNISLNQLYKLALTLLDMIVVEYSDKKNELTLNYWIANQYRNKLSDQFFDGHSLSCIVIIDADTYKIKKIYEPSLEG